MAPLRVAVGVAQIRMRIQLQHGEIALQRQFQNRCDGAKSQRMLAAQQDRELAAEKNFADHFGNSHRHVLRAAHVRLHVGGGVDAHFTDFTLQLDIEQFHVHGRVDDRTGAFARTAAPGCRGIVGHGNNDKARIFKA